MGNYLDIIRRMERSMRGNLDPVWTSKKEKRLPATAFPAEWLSTWRELATLTHGITHENPQFQPVIEALDACDSAFLANDWGAFQQATLRVRELVKGGKGT